MEPSTANPAALAMLWHRKRRLSMALLMMPTSLLSSWASGSGDMSLHAQPGELLAQEATTFGDHRFSIDRVVVFDDVPFGVSRFDSW